MIGHRKASGEIRRDYFERRKEGVLLRKDGIRCILQGKTTVAEVLRVA
jgi:type II secretory ATPase GspE/PulE/Tfp pilus assembly ATPase PilB-like protein